VLGLLAVASTAIAAPTITPRMIATFPHDPAAFTEGLVLHDGFLFESTGLTGSVLIQEDGVAFSRLNELECVGDQVLANVWLTDTILHIDPETGNVLTKIDAAGLLTPREANGADVLRQHLRRRNRALFPDRQVLA
jgi:glutamine cyclotransferase